MIGSFRHSGLKKMFEGNPRRIAAHLRPRVALALSALDAAESERKLGVLAAFLTAASLLVAGAGAYWAAMQGGNHRDKQTVFQWFKRF